MRAGRHRHRPTDDSRRQVALLAGYGITQPDIAKLISISDRTLRLYYRNELDTGHITASAKVAASLFEMATKNKVPAAAIFWLKARAGWKDRQDLTIDGTQTVQLQHLLAAKTFSAQLHGELEPAEPPNLREPAAE
jgi:hypothetical protein